MPWLARKSAFASVPRSRSGYQVTRHLGWCRGRIAALLALVPADDHLTSSCRRYSHAEPLRVVQGGQLRSAEGKMATHLRRLARQCGLRRTATTLAFPAPAGSGTLMTRTSPTRYMNVARMRVPSGSRSVAGGLARGVALFEGTDLVVGQGHVKRGCGVGEVLLPGGADDGGADDRVAQNPGERDLGHRHAVPLSDMLDRVGDGLVVVGQDPAGDVVGIAARGLLTPGAGKTAPGEGAPRDRSDTLVGEQAEHLALLLALHEAVLVLHRDEPGPAVQTGQVLHLGELPGPHGRRAEVADLPGLDHVMQGIHGLLDRRGGVEAGDLVEV